jgi:TldD protein
MAAEAPNGVVVLQDPGLVDDVVKLAQKLGADFADVRLKESEATNAIVQDGKAGRMGSSMFLNMGTRVLVNGAWGFSVVGQVTDRLAKKGVRDAVAMARASSRTVKEKGRVAEIGPFKSTEKTKVKKDPRDVAIEDKVKTAAEFERASREHDERIVNSIAGYGDGYSRQIIANTFGTWRDLTQISTPLSVVVTAHSEGRRQMAFEHRGRTEGYELVDSLSVEDLSIKAASRAVDLLSAEQAPAGTTDVVISPAVTGLLAHEALGHNAEADGVETGDSILKGRIGQKVAGDLVTIVDDPTIEGLYGSYPFDHEGTPSRRVAIMENGVLKQFMTNLETSAKLDLPPTGSARASGAGSRPLVRMSNTFIEPGDMSFEELIEGIDEGIYFKGGYWGYVFVQKGQFTCNVEEGWMIKNGKLGQHLRDVSFGGSTLDVLSRVDGVGNDLEMKIPGQCGKRGQGMKVDGGGPSLRIRDVVVGGYT